MDEEPERNQQVSNAYKVATIGGISIFIHWSWLFAFFFITWSLGDYYNVHFKHWGAGTAYLVGAISALLLFVTVLLHELAHSFTARAQGLPVRTIYLFIFGGVSNLTQEPQSPRVELLVAIAGPLTSLALAGIFFLLHAAVGSSSSQVSAVLGYLASINLILAIFNLIPGFPLDGGRVLRAIIWMIVGSQRRATRIASNIGNGIGYLFILGGVLEALVGGNFIAGIWLAFIGWFLHNAATASYQQAVMESMLVGVEVRRAMDAIGVTVPPDTPMEALVYRHMLSDNQRAIPVTEFDGTFLGLVTLSDVREIAPAEWSVTPVSRIMTPLEKLSTVSPDDDLRSALRVMAEHGYHQLPVMYNDRLVGMLNRAHVLQYLHTRQMMERTGSSGAGVAPPTNTAP